MSTVATTIRIRASLRERYDQLARATGRTHNYLMAEALERYAVRDGRQIERTCATLATLEAGTLETIDLDDLIAEDLATGKITPEDFGGQPAARRRRGLAGAPLNCLVIPSAARNPRLGYGGFAPLSMTKVDC